MNSADLYSTQFKWYPKLKRNGCAYCSRECTIKFIAQEDDRLPDYEHRMCNCPTAKKTGIPYKDCN